MEPTYQSIKNKTMKKEIELPKGAKLTIEYDEHTSKLSGVSHFKKGDFVYWVESFYGYHGIIIIKEDCPCDDCLPYFVHLNISNEINFNSSIGTYHRTQRFATKQEKQNVLDALNKMGKDWDFEKMELVKFIWTPKPGDVCVNDKGSVFIFKKMCKNGAEPYIGFWSDKTFTDGEFYSFGIRLANREERTKFFERLVKEGYKWDSKKLELTKRWVPRDGDFVTSVTPNGKSVAIYKRGEYKCGEFLQVYANILYNGCLFFGEEMRCNRVKHNEYNSTESEKQTLLDAMHSAGKDWDAVNKKVVDYRWKPKLGESYFVPNPLSFDFYTILSWDNDISDNTKLGRGLVFKTKEESISRAKQMLEK